ncbi:hypothetical protein SY88_08700 [Clostridiales bacterium PH28_bin88]|nr:hypothetical protein SY88_08700 [Clostridiales bacterium PH28_bin88]
MAGTTGDVANNANSIKIPVTAEVRGGQLLVQHPEGGPYPAVVPPAGVKLIVNGKPRTGPTVITKDDQVQLEAVDETVEGNWRLEVTRDGLKALLTVKPTEVIKRSVMDVPPAQRVTLQVNETVCYQSPLTMEKVMGLLTAEGIIAGIDWQACTRATLVDKEETLVVAEGQPPVPGQDAWIKFFFSLEDRIPVVIGEEEQIDYRERFTFTSVETGELLAEKQPGIPGRPGTTVRGEILPPEPPKEVFLAAGKGVSLTEDGMRAVAVQTGRPVITRRGAEVKLDVLSGFVHPGDVDLASGNIKFRGDITITGSVTEGMTVDALGNIHIGKDVDRAMIHAGGSVSIGSNAISSVIMAGAESVLLLEVMPIISDLSHDLSVLLEAVEQLKTRPAFKVADLENDARPLLKLLLELKFRHLPARIGMLQSLLQADQMDLLGNDVKRYCTALNETLVELSHRLCGLDEIHRLQEESFSILKELSEASHQRADVMLSYALNTTIKAGGDVLVYGQGCYNSTIVAGGSVHIRNVFRGGEISAAGDVKIRELGSRGGVPARVRVAPQSAISLGTVWENSAVQIGTRSHVFNVPAKRITIRLDNEGQPQFI